MAFTQFELKQLKQTFKEFIKNMKRLGIHPRVNVEQKNLLIIIDLEELVQVIKNMVNSSVSTTTQRYLRWNIRRDGQLMIVEVGKYE